jgi:putative ABC transport system permease protein
MNRMIIANLVHRPVRSIISIIAVALEVTLILVIVGLSLGMLNDSRERNGYGIGADLMVRPPGSSFLVGMNGAPLLVSIGKKIQSVPHVKVVTPVFTQLSAGTSLETIFGIDLPSYEAMGKPFRYIAGGPFQQPFDVIVDDVFAASKKGLKIGDKLEVLNRDFRVAGIVAHGKGARKLIPITTLQNMTESHDKCSLFYVKLDDPQYVDEVKNGILKLNGMGEYHVLSMHEWLSLMQPETLPGFSIFLDVVIGVAMVIGFMVIFQSMYTAVNERTREIGILKSLGASKSYIVRVILRETLLVAIAGTIVGIGLSYLSAYGIRHALPTLQGTVIIPEWILRSTILALFGALLGAFYPALKAAQKDPIDALAYE